LFKKEEREISLGANVPEAPKIALAIFVMIGTCIPVSKFRIQLESKKKKEREISLS